MTSDRPYHKAMTPRRGDRACSTRRRARRSTRPCVRDVHSTCCRSSPKQVQQLEDTPRRLSLVAVTGQRPAASAGPGPTQGHDGLRRHRPRAPRNLRALRDRADDGDEPRRVRHDGAHHVEADQPGAVQSCALFLFDEESETLRCRFATGAESDAIATMTMTQRAGSDRDGSRATAAAGQRAAERRLRGGRAHRPRDHVAVGAGLAAGLQRSLHRHAGRLSRRRRTSTPTTIAACSSASRSRRRPSSTTRSCSSRRRKTR